MTPLLPLQDRNSPRNTRTENSDGLRFACHGNKAQFHAPYDTDDGTDHPDMGAAEKLSSRSGRHTFDIFG